MPLLYTKSKYILASLVLAITFSGLRAQVVSIPPSGIVRENFNSMGSGTTLPTGWRVNTTAGTGGTSLSYSIGGTSSLTTAANSGTPTTGGRYNWGTVAGTDRAVGFLTTASPSFPAPNAVMVDYRNTMGSTITSVTLSYSLEQYRVNTDAFSLQLYSSTNGSTWTAQTGGDVSTATFLAGPSAFNFSTPVTVYKTVTISGLNITNNNDLFFMWVFTSAAGNAAPKCIGLDDVTLQAGTGVPNVSAGLDDILATDVNANGIANPGDKLTYKATIRNTGNANAAATTYTNPAQANTTATGTVKTSALAMDDPSYTLASQGGTLVVPQGTGVLINDFGLPSLTVASFGNSTNTSATVANGTNTIISDNGATVTMNANGSFTYNAGAVSTFAGYDRFGYTATTGNVPDNDAIVTVAVGTAPSAVADAYNVIGNVGISPNAAQGVLANDVGTGRAIIAVNGVAANVGVATATTNGSVTMNVDGSFSYTSTPGFEGSDNFTYTIDNSFSAPSTATVTLTIGGVIWFVNNNAGSNGTGTLASPFNSLTNFQSVNNGTGNNPASQDKIFFYESSTAYSGNLTLLSNQVLIGQDATSTLAALTGLTVQAYTNALPAMNTGGNATTLTSASGNTVTLNSGGTANKLYGFTLGNSAAAALTGTSFGTLNGADVIINTTNQAIALTTGTVGIMSFPSVTSSGGINNIFLNGVDGGTITISGGALTGATGNSFYATGASLADINVSCTVAKSTGGGGAVVINGKTGGTVNFSAAITAGTTGTGIDLQTNTGATFTFTGGMNLNTGTNVAFNAAGGGTLNVTGTNNISTTSAIGLAINGVNAGGSSITFQSIISGTGKVADINTSTGTKTLGRIVTNSAATNALSLISAGTVNVGDPSLASSLTTSTAAALIINSTVLAILGGQELGLTTTSGTGVNVTGGTVSISGGRLVIITTTGTGFNQTANGSVTLTGSNNTITTSSGIGLNITSSDAGAGGITFASILSTSGMIANISTSTGTKTLGRIVTNSAATNALSLISAGTVNVGDPSLASSLTTSTAAALIINSTVLAILGGQEVGLTTTLGTGVSMTGGTVSISGGRLVIVTTIGTGFGATSGGTVTLTGSGNTISTGTGTALNVASTTIGASNLNFQSISSNGGSKGIVLNATGSGGLVVTGVGTTAGSGGTIQNKTSNGIELVSANNISLQNMNLTSNAQTQTVTNLVCGNNLAAGDPTGCVANLYMNNAATVSLTNMSVSGSSQVGIVGNAVSAFSLTNSNIFSNGNEDYEDGLLFKNLSGTSIITNTTIQNNYSRQAVIYNTTGNLTLTGTGSTFGRTVAPTVSSQHGLLMVLDNSTATSVDFGTCSFVKNGNGNGLLINVQGSATLGTSVTHSSIHNSTNLTNNAAHVFVNTTTNAVAYFDVLNNSVMTLAGLQSIDYFVNPASTATSQITGIIQGNTIGTTGVAGSGCNGGGCDGMTIDKAGAGQMHLKILGNTIQQIITNGIAMSTTNSSTLDASITGNTIRQPAGGINQGNAMLFNVGANSGSTTTACLNITGNTIQETSQTWDINGSGASIYFNTKNATLTRLPGYAGSSTGDAAFATFVSGNNTFNLVSTIPVLSTRFNGSTYGGGAACSTP